MLPQSDKLKPSGYSPIRVQAQFSLTRVKVWAVKDLAADPQKSEQIDVRLAASL